MISLVLLTSALVPAQEVIIPANLSGDLQTQFENAFRNFATGKGFWIGYSITRKDKHEVFIGSYYNDKFGPSLREMITSPGKYRQGNKSWKFSGRSFQITNFGSFRDGDEPDEQTAILFRYNSGSKNINDFTEIGICNLARNFYLDKFALIWLGKQENRESLDFLFHLYKNAGDLETRKNLVGGIGIHPDQSSVTSFLTNLLKRNSEKELRKKAAFWLGLQNSTTALETLKSVAVKDESVGVRKNAVYGMGMMTLPGIIDELVYVARHNGDREVRKSAVYAIGNKAVKKAEEALKDFIENDPDIEIKKSAVYSLANCSLDSIPYLIKIAKSNKSLEIRKCAIYSLGNSDDKRAFDALIELAKN